MRLLIGDIAAVIEFFPQERAVVVGHDWGGAIAWQVAIWRPDLVEKLVVLSTPHPNGLQRELVENSVSLSFPFPELATSCSMTQLIW